MGKHSKMTWSMDEHYRVLEVQVPIHSNTFCQVTSMHSLNDHSSILKEKLPVRKITGLKFLITV
ncbi:hypothetical protein C5167_042138 [Papaver somniferum]|nr:hypothetical protein C5167_042138 [Papaver somniferum]